MSSGRFTTFKDAIAYVMDVADSTGDRYLRLARRAVSNAYYALPHKHPWKYYSRRLRLTLNGAFEDGTVAFTASNGNLTLTGGTWPAWAASGVVRIDAVDYQVESRTSNSVIVLSNGPSEDLAAGTTYILVRDKYTLPIDFNRSAQFRNVENNIEMVHVTPEELMEMYVTQESSGWPRYYAYVADRDIKNRIALWVYPAPDTDYHLDSAYRSSPPPVRIHSYNTGLVSAAGSTVTGSNTAWTSDMVGSVIRFGTAAKGPDGPEGPNMYAEEAIIDSVDSATSLTLIQDLDGSYTNVKYEISDLLDIADSVMQNLFWALLETEFSRLSRNDNYQQRFIALQTALREAKAADHANVSTPLSPYSQMDIGSTGTLLDRTFSDYNR